MHLLCLCLEGIIVKKNRYVRGNVFFICWWYRIFYFFLFSSAAFVLVVFACLALIGYQLIQQGHQQKAMKVEIKEKGIIDEEKQIYRTETYLKKYVCRQCTNDGSYL